jgi:thiol:disulfide interchange protein DsbC
VVKALYQAGIIMKKQFVGIALLLLAVSLSGLSLAESNPREAITRSLGKVFPGTTPSEINPSPMEGVSEVLIGPRLFYISNDGKYLLQGSLIDIATRTDIGEERRNGIRLNAINELSEEKMIVFPAKNSRHTITVFTDIDCGYCRKLHDEIDQFNAKGITVRYLAFPRSGIGAASYNKAVSVWCDKDRQAAMTRAKSGETLPKADCDNPVREEYELGQLIGVQGTPAIVMEDGALLPGYVPAAKLAAMLDKGT